MTIHAKRLAALLVALAGCGGPILQNAPRPNTAAVAGVAAGAAAAITLADPDAAAKRQEAKKPEKEKRPVKNDETVPASVFDRLDDKAKHPAAPDAAPATAPTDGDGDDTAPAETSGVKSPVPLKH